MTNGRAKGNAAEREIAALAQRWWSQVEPGCEFVRTPLSGGWGSPSTRAGFRASGDLMTTARLFPFVVEVKRREGWTTKTLYEGKPSPVWGWWEQASKAAYEMRASPLLFFRRSRSEWLAMLPKEYGVKFVRGDALAVVRYFLKPDSWRPDVPFTPPMLLVADVLFRIDPALVVHAASIR